MTGEHLDTILKLASAKTEKDGWQALPEGNAMTLHVAHDGASMTVSRIDAVKQEGDLVYARTPRRELFVVVRSDIFAAAFEGEPNARVARRAGFG